MAHQPAGSWPAVPDRLRGAAGSHMMAGSPDLVPDLPMTESSRRFFVRTMRARSIEVGSGAALVVCCLSACGASDEGGLPAVATRDSAGIRIVVNDGATDSARVLAEPELRIGIAMGDPAYEFHRIGPIAVNGPGEIFVGDGGSATIRVYDPGGTFVRQFGGGGRGPGEFQSLNTLWFIGDTVVVTDRRLARATLFSADGTLLDTWDLRTPEALRVDPVARTSSGILAVVRGTSLHFTAEPLRLFQDTIELRTFDPAATAVGPPLRRWPGERRIAGTAVYPIRPLFEPRTLLAVRPDGFQYQAFDGQYRIDVFDAGGRLVRRIVREVPPVAITTQHVEAVQALLANQPRGSEQRTAVEVAAGYPVAPHFATLGAIVVAADGSFLVQRIDDVDPVPLERASGFGGSERTEHVSATTEARWERFDADGRYLGAVRFPRRYFPRHYDGAAVLGVLEDDDGVQSVARFRLDPAAS
jgi:hypothetical protein